MCIIWVCLKIGVPIWGPQIYFFWLKNCILGPPDFGTFPYIASNAPLPLKLICSQADDDHTSAGRDWMPRLVLKRKLRTCEGHTSMFAAALLVHRFWTSWFHREIDANRTVRVHSYTQQIFSVSKLWFCDLKSKKIFMRLGEIFMRSAANQCVL